MGREVYVAEPNKGSAYLTVVKRPAHRQVVHVFIKDGRHLSFLDRRDPATREENEHRYIGFVAQAVDSSTSSVATGGPDDSEFFWWFSG